MSRPTPAWCVDGPGDSMSECDVSDDGSTAGSPISCSAMISSVRSMDRVRMNGSLCLSARPMLMVATRSGVSMSGSGSVI